MKRFHFTLEALLEMRKRKEDAAKLELAQKRQAVRAAQEKFSELTEDLKKLQQSEKTSRSAALSVSAMRFAVAFRHKLKLDMIAQGRSIDRLHVDAERARLRLVTATQKKRAIELLKEKRHDQWRKQAQSHERKLTDDISQIGYIRKQREAFVRAEAVVP